MAAQRRLSEREAAVIEAVLRIAGLSPCAVELIPTVRALSVLWSEDAGDTLRFACPDPNEWYGLLADGTGTSSDGEERYVVVRGTSTFISRVEVFNAAGDNVRFPDTDTIRPSGWQTLAPA